MAEVTILIPTYRHPHYLPYAIESALGQDVPCEILVVGDGVEDDTRAVMRRLGAPVRFFDFPKGERHGEAYRHQVLQEATGSIVCYLGDNDLLLPNHASEMSRILESADFTHSVPMFLHPKPYWLEPGWMNLNRQIFRDHLIDGNWNQISLTGAAHTMEAYRRLPYGWRPAPEGVWTDMYMWQQWLSTPAMRLVSGTLCTHIKFTEEWRTEMSVKARMGELAYWLRHMHNGEFQEQLIHLAETSRTQSLHYQG